MEADTALLPKGTSSFMALRQNGQIYIDKTDLVYALARHRDKLFLSRPRRFGKSLLVSTLETLFRDGLKWFDGLKIDGLWKDKTYGVVKLDFSEFKDGRSLGEMRLRFDELLQIAFEKVGFIYAPDSDRSCLGQLKAWIDRQEPNSLVLLVDEYDAPLNSHLDDSPFFEEIRDMLSGFFAMIKASDRVWRFIFITGIAKFNKASIFSAFNTLTDISLDAEYGTLLGYTEQEIMDNFGDFVKDAANINGMTTESMIAAMRKQYDGFCFDDEASTHVYAPWSVLNFLSSRQKRLRNYWYDSAGQPSMLVNYLHGRDVFTANTYDKPQYVPLKELRQTNDLSTLSDAVLLCQAGYLTIKAIDGEEALLGYPNGEVASSIASLTLSATLRNRRLRDIGAGNLRERFSANDPDDVAAIFNAVLLSIDYQMNPISSEAACRSMIQVFLLGAGLNPVVEKHTALGRSDLELTVGNTHWVFELKFLPRSSTDGQSEEHIAAMSHKLLGEAMQQIQARHYGEPLVPALSLIRMGMVYSEQKRSFVCWQKFNIL